LIAAGTLVWSLAACSWFGITTGQSDVRAARHSGSEGGQYAALPDYLSDNDPARQASEDRSAAPTAPLVPLPRAKPARRGKPIVITLADILKQASLSSLTPLAAPVDPRPRTLADLLEDRAWRQRTARRLDILLR
jgi:hypothetical protein